MAERPVEHLSIIRGQEDKTWSKWPQGCRGGGSPALSITSRCPAQARAEEAEKHRALQNGRLKQWGAEPAERCSPAQGQGKALRPTRKTSAQLGVGLPCTHCDVWLQIQGEESRLDQGVVSRKSFGQVDSMEGGQASTQQHGRSISFAPEGHLSCSLICKRS